MVSLVQIQTTRDLRAKGWYTARQSNPDVMKKVLGGPALMFDPDNQPHYVYASGDVVKLVPEPKKVEPPPHDDKWSDDPSGLDAVRRPLPGYVMTTFSSFEPGVTSWYIGIEDDGDWEGPIYDRGEGRFTREEAKAEADKAWAALATPAFLDETRQFAETAVAILNRFRA